MIDFIKLHVNINPNILLNNPYLNFTQNVNTQTGEIKPIYEKSEIQVYKQSAYYKNLMFEIFSTGSIFISGSLHKYYNSGKHNYNDFTQNDFRCIVNELKNKFDIEPKECDLKCLEVGVNIPIMQNVDCVINNCLLHRKQPFEHTYNSNERNYKQARHTEYIVKIYNKGKHYRLNSSLLRFEIKYCKMRILNKKGIKTLFDLYNTDLSIFRDALLNEWQNILFYDFTLQIHTLSKNQQLKLSNYNNYLFWQSMSGKDEVHKYKHHLNEMRRYINQYSLKTQNSITNQMTYTIDNLLNPPNSHFIYNVKKECIITGIDISFQKDSSIMLSHTGLYYLYENNKLLFDEVKNKYLSKKWISSSLPIQIKEIAHNIRNNKSNALVKQQNIYSSNQYNLLTIFSEFNLLIFLYVLN